METADRQTSRDDAVGQLHQQLQESLQELVTSEDWQRALAVAARFRDYSFANSRLIWAQSISRGFTPNRVAGYRAWQELGRHVRKGERGLQILAPVIRNVIPENGAEEERRVVGFRVVHVFDIAQTEGEPLPEVPIALVEGDLPTHWDQVCGLITDSGFDLEVADLDRLGEANGVTDWNRHDVVVRAGMPGAQRFKTAVHELAHIRLHDPTSDGRPSCRGVVEVEAESVAYMVCADLGIDSGSYSLGYVASWSGGDLTKVAATASRVIGCARDVLDDIEQKRHLEREPIPPASQIEARSREPVQQLDSSATRPDLEEVVRAATAFYQRQLENPEERKVVEYLNNRCIGTDSISLWQLGYAPDSWHTLTTELRGEGFSDDLLLSAGVAGRSRDGRLYDLMRNRVIFPIHDEHGAARGFAGRLVAGEGPKYLNTPETDLYQKRSLLYGMHLAQQPITNARTAVVVEGYTDAIAAHQAGITNVVATAGTSLTSEHVSKLGGMVDSVVLAFDGDHAGLLAANRTAEIRTAETPRPIRILIAHLPEGQDPAELLTSDIKLFEQALDVAIPVEHHLIDQIVNQHNLEEPEAVARAIREAKAVIAPIGDMDNRTNAAAHLANRIGRSESFIQSALSLDQHLDHQRGRGLA